MRWVFPAFPGDYINLSGCSVSKNSLKNSRNLIWQCFPEFLLFLESVKLLKSSLMDRREFSIELKSSCRWQASEGLENNCLLTLTTRVSLCSSQTWPRCLKFPPQLTNSQALTEWRKQHWTPHKDTHKNKNLSSFPQYFLLSLPSHCSLLLKTTRKKPKKPHRNKKNPVIKKKKNKNATRQNTYRRNWGREERNGLRDMEDKITDWFI